MDLKRHQNIQTIRCDQAQIPRFPSGFPPASTLCHFLIVLLLYSVIVMISPIAAPKRDFGQRQPPCDREIGL